MVLLFAGIEEWNNEGYHNIHGCITDLSSFDGRSTFIDYIHSKVDRIDCLINNVGFNIRKPTLEFSEDDYDRVMNTNLKSCYFLTQKLQPLLTRSVKGASGMYE